MNWRRLLRPLAWLYTGFVALRNWGFDCGLIRTRKLPEPVIGIGNIAAGGTGKTPLTINLCEALLAQGQKPGILTRGYGAGLRRQDRLALLRGLVVASDGHFQRVPDEAMLQSQRLPDVPVVIGADRFRTGRWAGNLGLGVDVWVMDDGFQHRALYREHNILVLDANLKVESGPLIPEGLLREPVAGCRRATAILLSRALRTEFVSSQTIPLIDEWLPEAKECLKVRFQIGPIYNSETKAVWQRNEDPLLAVCGIAKPDSFLTPLKEKGANIQAVYQVKDHQVVSPMTLARKAESATAVVTTEKDYWRNPGVFRRLGKPVMLAPLVVDLSREHWQRLGVIS